jgi:lipoate---protein ligase
MWRIVLLNNVPVLEQLRLEEALLRTSCENWYLLNTGSPPAIVMGISGQPKKLLNQSLVAQDAIPVIKRFSGGGTVYIDSQTVFATVICNSDSVDIPLQPQPLLQWSERFYAPVFPGFALRENDYVLGDKKFGGNAQYIQKNRWLLHTSLLWDYTPTKMAYLLLPAKRPAYRKDRPHHAFLCALNSRFPTKERLLAALAQNAQTQLGTTDTDPSLAWEHLQRPHRRSTLLLPHALQVELDPDNGHTQRSKHI